MSEHNHEADLVAMSKTDEAVSEMLDRFLTAIAHSAHYIQIEHPDTSGFTVSDRIADRGAAFESVDQSTKGAWIFSEEAEQCGNTGALWNLYCETPNMVGHPESDHPENVGPVQGVDADGIDLYDAINIQPGTDPYSDDGSDAVFITVIREGERMVPQEITDFLTGAKTVTGEAVSVDKRWYETIGWCTLSDLDLGEDGEVHFGRRRHGCMGKSDR